MLKFKNIFVGVIITIIIGVTVFGIRHAHINVIFTKMYCPKCYTPAKIRIDLQKECENCGWKFYLDKTEIPKK